MFISYDHYRIFYFVAKYGSFTRAAEALFCNQPNLTRTIRNLETSLGCTLFERTNKGVTLTDDGKELYEHISIAFEHIYTPIRYLLVESQSIRDVQTRCP